MQRSMENFIGRTSYIQIFLTILPPSSNADCCIFNYKLSRKVCEMAWPGGGIKGTLEVFKDLKLDFVFLNIPTCK